MLKNLESIAKTLDPTENQLAEWMRLLGNYAVYFQKWLPDSPTRAENVNHHFSNESLPLAPQELSDIIHQLNSQILLDGLNTSSGKYMPYVAPGGLPIAAVADFLAALTNRQSGVYGACPGAVEVENVSIRWLKEIVGFPETAWGSLHSGGALAALSALVCARNTRPVSDWSKSVIYLTRETHYSIEKMLCVMVLGHLDRRLVPLDDKLRMSLNDFVRIVQEDQAKGLQPWIVIASAGTTNSGAVDPIGEIISYAREQGIWVHVDAAYGGFFILTEQCRGMLAEMANADSLVVDPHKGLFLPHGCGAVLVRERKHLFDAFSYRPAYLADLEGHDVPSPVDYSPEGSRHFRALRLWMALKLHGLETFRSALSEKLILAQLAFENLKQIPRLEMGPQPQLSTVLFRIADPDNSKTQNLLASILDSGSFWCNSTKIEGKFYIRICILNFRTHEKEIMAAVETVRNLAKSAT